MARSSIPTCPRCEAPLPRGARYCHVCGVSIASAESGEFATLDLDRFFNYALDLLCIAGTDGFFKRVNPAFERTLGWTTKEVLSTPFVELIHPEDRQDTIAEVGMLESGRPTVSFVNRFRCKDGSYRDLQWTSYPEPATGLLYAVARDVTELRRRQDARDGLTGLATRRVFDETLPAEWNRAARLGDPLALALVDVDRLRDFNAAHGYHRGDNYLKTLASALTQYARRAGDVVARLGGQRFAMLMVGRVTAEQLASHAQRVCAAARAIAIEDVPRVPTVSVGAASVVPEAENHHRTMVTAAEAALHEAQAAGGDRAVVEGAT